MSDIAVRVADLGKVYKIGGLESYRALRDTLTDAVYAPFRRVRSVIRKPLSRRATDAGSELIWALREVSFEVKRGEVLGIIGGNGAGKSTLLKILSRVTEPTEGVVEIHGRVGSLLEVGTGFHPELTGRENIYLNGAILGMKKAEIERRFDEIVAFSQVERFIDTPVKRYSSGMYLRLAFAVAAHLEPEILVVDEVLAVGDKEFQKRCLGKMENVAGQGRTVLFVSHNMDVVRHLCTRGLLLSRGRIICQGPIADVINAYLTTVTDIAEEVIFPERPEKAAQLTRLCLRNSEGKQISRPCNTESLTLEIEYLVRRTLVDDHLWLALDRADGLRVLKAGDDDAGNVLPAVRTPGRYIVRVQFPGGVLNEGVYRFRVVIGKPRSVHHDDQFGGHFEIEDVASYGQTFLGKRNGVLRLVLTWREEKLDQA